MNKSQVCIVMGEIRQWAAHWGGFIVNLAGVGWGVRKGGHLPLHTGCLGREIIEETLKTSSKERFWIFPREETKSSFPPGIGQFSTTRLDGISDRKTENAQSTRESLQRPTPLQTRDPSWTHFLSGKSSHRHWLWNSWSTSWRRHHNHPQLSSLESGPGTFGAPGCLTPPDSFPTLRQEHSANTRPRLGLNGYYPEKNMPVRFFFWPKELRWKRYSLWTKFNRRRQETAQAGGLRGTEGLESPLQAGGPEGKYFRSDGRGQRGGRKWLWPSGLRAAGFANRGEVAFLYFWKSDF